MSTISERNALRYYALGLSSAVFVMAFFGTVWSVWGSSVIPPGTITILYYCAVGLIALVLAAVGIWLIRAILRLPHDASPKSKQRSIEGRRYGVIFGIVFGLEGLFLTVANYLFSNTVFTPVAAIIVGLHFLPLARLFKVWPYYVTGAILTLLGLITLLAIPINTTLGAGYAWIGVPCIGSTLTLYATAIAVCFIARNVAYRVRA